MYSYVPLMFSCPINRRVHTSGPECQKKQKAHHTSIWNEVSQHQKLSTPSCDGKEVQISQSSCCTLRIINIFVYMRAITNELERIMNSENNAMERPFCESGFTRLLTWPAGGAMAGIFKIASYIASCCFASEAIVVRSCNKWLWAGETLCIEQWLNQQWMKCEELNRSKAEKRRLKAWRKAWLKKWRKGFFSCE